MKRASDQPVWWPLPVSLALIAFFARAWLVAIWGSPVPYWDQWGAEALDLYRPWLEHTLHWQDLFAAHNEHRIVLTRLAALGLFVLQDGWHPWTQLLLNCALHAIAAGLLFRALARDFTLRPLIIFSFVLGLLVTTTAGWQNALWGFQSQFYFAELFGLGAWIAMSTRAPLSIGWWLGLLSAALALLANAAGWLVPVSAAGGMLVGQLHAPSIQRKRLVVGLGLLGLLTFAGIMISANAAHHAPLHAKSLSQFWTVLSRCLAWPYVQAGGIAFLAMQAPLPVLVALRWRGGAALTSSERAAVMIALHAGLSAAAVAYSRGAGLIDAVPLSRYQDALILGSAAQLFAVLGIARLHGRSGRLAAIGWITLLLAGLIAITTDNLTRHLPFKQAQDEASLIMVRSYAATGDPKVFSSMPGMQSPNPTHPAFVAVVMANPTIKPYLPAELSQPQGTPLNPPWLIRHARLLALISTLILAGSLAMIALRSRRQT